MPYATGSGVRIHYEVEGSRAPLVLYPGFAGSLADWYSAGYVDALKGRHTLVLIDPRGHGASDKPHEPELYAPARRVADVLAVLDALGIDRAHFLGYSMGGWVGFELGVRAPRRCRSLLIGGADPFGRSPRPAWAQVLRRGMESFLAEIIEPAMGPAPDARVRARWLDNDGEALAAAILAEWPNREPDLGAMQLPVLLYGGERDTTTAQARRAAALLPQATFVSLPELGHLEGLFRGDAVLPHLTAFLERVSGGAGRSAASS